MIRSRSARISLTTAALVGFAANSLLCRQALSGHDGDPVAFTAIRLASGALVLWALARRRAAAGRWSQALALFAYALAFSLAYVELDAGTGALILFACVQVTMFAFAVVSGQRPTRAEWLGMLIAMAGLWWLLRPGGGQIPVGPAVLMGVAGIAWGAYTLLGAGTVDPLGATAGNFVRALPLIAVVALGQGVGSGLGLDPGLALYGSLSGALASGLGYACWYAALRDLRPSQAAVLQLVVPVLAAVGGILFLAERVSERLLAAGGLILLGVGLAIRSRRAR